MELTSEKFVGSDNHYYLKMNGAVIGIVEVNEPKATLEIKTLNGWRLKL